MKYIQSFYQYPVTFSAIGKTVPARSAQGEMKNIAEVSEKELEKLENCEPFFRELVSKKKYRVLNHIPASYVPPAEQINNAHKEADDLRAENEALKAKLAALEETNKNLDGDRMKAVDVLIEKEKKIEELENKDSSSEEPKKTTSSKKSKK